MRTAYRMVAATGLLLASLCMAGQVGGSMRNVVLPSPQLIHCRAAECSQLWKQDSSDGGIVYPAQVLTDFVNGEVVGLTAVYDKSVSKEEIRAAIMVLFGTSPQVVPDDWRVESEQLVIAISRSASGAYEVLYLKMGTYASHVPSEHLDCPGKKSKKPACSPDSAAILESNPPPRSSDIF